MVSKEFSVNISDVEENSNTDEKYEPSVNPITTGSAVASESKNMIKISGSTLNEFVESGMVIVKDLSGIELLRTIIGKDGNFTLDVDSSKVKNGYILSVSGGKINGKDFNETLNAVYDGNHDKSKANITLVTSLIHKLSRDGNGADIEKFKQSLQKLVDMGMIKKDDWFTEQPENVDTSQFTNAIGSHKNIDKLISFLVDDAMDGEINSQIGMKIFKNANGGIAKFYDGGGDELALFPGDSNFKSLVALDLNNQIIKNINYNIIQGPSWIDLEKGYINLKPNSTNTDYGDHVLKIEATSKGVKIGKTYQLNIALLKKNILVSGQLGPNGGEISNKMKDIVIFVEPNKLKKVYDVQYIAGVNERSQFLASLDVKQDITNDELAEINIMAPPRDIIISNYLSTSIKQKSVSNNRLQSRSIKAEDYSKYSDNAIPYECKPKLINGKINEMVWTDEVKDNVYFPYVWQGKYAQYIYPFKFVGNTGYTSNGGEARVLKKYYNKKIDVGWFQKRTPITKCSSALRSYYPKNENINGKEAVLFVHGFIRSGKLGGYDQGDGAPSGEYFGRFPRVAKYYKTKDGREFIPFVFQWRTNARFQDVASELGRAVKELGDKTNRKVHIVAHSYGGVLARTLSQGLASDGQYDKEFAQKYIATLTTVGSPHTGTWGEENENKVSFDGGVEVSFPEGRHAGIAGNSISQCEAITCYQTGTYTDSLVGNLKKVCGLEDKKGTYLINFGLI